MFFCFLIALFFNIIFESESIAIDIEKKNEINLYDGKWVRDSQLRKVDDSWKPINMYNRCKEKWMENHDDLSQYPYWKWETNSHEMQKFTNENFCELIKDRKGILFVGDSITRLFSYTLASMMKTESISKDKWSICNGNNQIEFIRNDFLDTNNYFIGNKCKNSDGNFGVNAKCFEFFDHLALYDTIIVNSGAHPRFVYEYGFEEYHMSMKLASTRISSKMNMLHDNPILIARNTVPGSWGCDENTFSAPKNITYALEMIQKSPPSYKWNDFNVANEIFESVFSYDNWNILDAYTPTILRADSHIGSGDCLHYCIPGPADLWVDFLYNIINVNL